MGSKLDIYLPLVSKHHNYSNNPQNYLDLLHSEVEEGEFVSDRDERLGPGTSHARTQTSVQFDDHQLVQHVFDGRLVLHVFQVVVVLHLQAIQYYMSILQDGRNWSSDFIIEQTQSNSRN